MKCLFLFSGFILICIFAKAQKKATVKDSSFTQMIDSLISVKQLNGLDIYSDSFYHFIHNKIDKYEKRIHYDTATPRVYFTNNAGTEYLELICAPDIGWEQYKCIGYTKNATCSHCGDYLGKLPYSTFFIDNGVKLGQSFGEVNKEMNLLLGYFRYFQYNRVLYCYYEKGAGTSRPYTPKDMYYYKFRDNKLFEIGFGNGFFNYNPMFQNE